MTSAVSPADLKSLPNLPGYTFPEYKDNYARPNTWNVVNGVRIEQKEGLSFDKPKFVKVSKAPDVWRSGSLPDSQTRAVFKNAGADIQFQDLPAWDAFDRHVLRFSGYFKESVVETNLENFRVRKVTIYYYLEDDTCQIIEPKQDNSGIPQGQLIRRHRFPSADGGYLKTEDIRVGSTLQIYGRSIFVTDCDPFTREFYESAGDPQGAPEPEEMDPFQETRQAMKNHAPVQPRTYEKVYREVMLGGGHINADMQQFLENDKRVLRFFAVLDDVFTPQFERRPFTIMFFLADDMIEIREQYPLNCGRDNFPIFFRKGKMPMGAYKVEGPQAQARKKNEYVHGHDFRVGMTVQLLGTYSFFIYDADEFTRRHFVNELGMELDPRVDVRLPERAVPRAKTPPYTGYGSWDDSMGSVTHLIPKQPKKDFVKLFRHEGKVLRFKAKFASPKPEDADRIFVISYYLQDDTIAIHEPPQRNLGIVTGRFLEKGVHMNQVTGELFQPNDLIPGKVVKIYNNEFLIVDMDEYSKKVFENPDALLRRFDLEAVLQKIRDSMRQQYPLVRDVFRKFDSDHDGVLTVAEFQQALEKFGFQLSPEDVLKIMRHFDTRKDGQVSYNEFCDALLDPDWTTVMMQTKPPLDDSHDHSYAERAMVKSAERAETTQVRKAIKDMGDVLYKKHNFIMKLLKEMQHITHEDHVSAEQIQHALEQVGHPFHIEDVQRAILYLQPDADLTNVNYRRLFSDVVTSYHDVSAAR
ncbi:EFHC1 [Symbiodinium microadriaticum]|nr:EFHC1 [Symbiodinium microadriaticum]CAE7689828.1 EFHC1 [Symbiodinium sp. KB8]